MTARIYFCAADQREKEIPKNCLSLVEITPLLIQVKWVEPAHSKARGPTKTPNIQTPGSSGSGHWWRKNEALIIFPPSGDEDMSSHSLRWSAVMCWDRPHKRQVQTWLFVHSVGDNQDVLGAVDHVLNPVLLIHSGSYQILMFCWCCMSKKGKD